MSVEEHLRISSRIACTHNTQTRRRERKEVRQGCVGRKRETTTGEEEGEQAYRERETNVSVRTHVLLRARAVLEDALDDTAAVGVRRELLHLCFVEESSDGLGLSPGQRQKGGKRRTGKARAIPRPPPFQPPIHPFPPSTTVTHVVDLADEGLHDELDLGHEELGVLRVLLRLCVSGGWSGWGSSSSSSLLLV